MRRQWRSALALTGLLCVATGQAGSLRVSPTSVVLDTKHPVAVLTVRNNNTVATAIEVQAAQWRQELNDDVYATTSDLIATPPIFELQPGASQIVRVGLRDARAADLRQRAFRVFVSEVPGQSADGSLQVLMRVALPVFVSAATARPQLHWAARKDSADRSSIVVRNSGDAHAQVLSPEIADRGGQLAANLPSLYVLPGATREWKIQAPAHAPFTLRTIVRDPSGEARVVVQIPVDDNGHAEDDTPSDASAPSRRL